MCGWNFVDLIMVLLIRWGMYMLSLERRSMLQLLCKASPEDFMQASVFFFYMFLFDIFKIV